MQMEHIHHPRKAAWMRFAYQSCWHTPNKERRNLLLPAGPLLLLAPAWPQPLLLLAPAWSWQVLLLLLGPAWWSSLLLLTLVEKRCMGYGRMLNM